MEFGQSINITEENNSENEGIDLKGLINKYKGYWKWFVLSFIISVLVGFAKLNFTLPQYEAIASIKIKNEQRGDRSTSSAFQDLNGMSSGYRDEIKDEIVILNSRSLIEEVIKTLELNIKYFKNKNVFSQFLDENLGMHTEFYELESYENPPLKLNFL